MKKLLKALCFALVLGFSVASIAACDISKDPAKEDEDVSCLVDPSQEKCQDTDLDKVKTFTWTAEDVTIDQHASFNVMKGIKVLGDNGVVYTNKVTYTSADPENFPIDEEGQLNTEKFGSVVINYSIVVDGVEGSTSRTITINEKEIDYSANMLPHGSFASEEDVTTYWALYTDAQSNVGYENGYMVLENLAVSGNSYGNRLNNNGTNNGITLEKGKTYELTFKAKAESSRAILVQIGQLLAGAPYWIQYGNGISEIFQLTTGEEDFSLVFVMNGDNTEIANITLECGTIAGYGTPAAGKVYFKDINIHLYSGEVVDTKAPVITAEDKAVYVGTDVDVNSLISVSDDFDGEITDFTTVIMNEAEEVVEAIDTTAAGVYTVTITAADKAGNEATKTIKITVKEKVSGVVAIENGDEPTCVKNGGWTEWHDQNWCGSNVTVTTATVGNGALTLEYSGSTAVWFGMQLFYSDPAITGELHFVMDINASTAGSITINGNVVELKAGDNHIDVTGAAGEQGSTVSIQFGVDGVSCFEAGKFVFTNFTVNDTDVLGDAGDGENPDTPVVDTTVVRNGEETAAVNEGGWVEWHDQGWCQSNVTVTEAKLVDGKLTLTYSGATTAAWFGMQLFYGDAEITGDIAVIMNINASVAGTVTVNGKTFDLIVGDNFIEVEAQPKNATGSVISMQFGTETPATVISGGTFVISDATANDVDILKSAGTTVEPEPVDTTGVRNGGEPECVKDGGWVEWHDQNWCGSNVTVTEAKLVDGKITLTYADNDAQWWGMQLFYGDAAVTGDVAVVMNINSTVAGKVTVNGVVFNLVVGDNYINVPAKAKNATGSVISMQFGTEAPASMIQAGTFVITNVKINDTVILGGEPVVIEGQESVDPTPGEGGSEETTTSEITSSQHEFYGAQFLGVVFKGTKVTASTKDDYTITITVNEVPTAQIVEIFAFGAGGDLRTNINLLSAYTSGDQFTINITATNADGEVVESGVFVLTVA